MWLVPYPACSVGRWLNNAERRRVQIRIMKAMPEHMNRRLDTGN